jgi:hypothetical protein
MAESSKKFCGSKGAVLPIVTLIAANNCFKNSPFINAEPDEVGTEDCVQEVLGSNLYRDTNYPVIFSSLSKQIQL